MFEAWRQYRAFARLPAAKRNIVFYAESRNDWHHFEPLIERLLVDHHRQVVYLTSDSGDPAYAYAVDRPALGVYCIGDGAVRTWAFQMLKADLLILTMMDLGNLQLKRSINPVHYLYVFHAPGSTHMVDHADSYDHYDTLFCVGPHHEREIRARERQAGLAPKHLVRHGYHRMEQLLRDAQAYRRRDPSGPSTVLLAPTWGDRSTLNLCGEALIESLLDAKLRVILRPHYMTVRQSPALVETLRARFGAHPRFEYTDLMGESDSLFESDVLISDWSSMAIEYALALEKPVLFIDVPMRVRNPDWQALGLEPIELAIRPRVGQILDPAQVDQAGARVTELLAAASDYRSRAAQAREGYLFNIGRSAEVGAREIVALADRLARSRAVPR